MNVKGRQSMKNLKKEILFILACAFVMLTAPAVQAHAGCGTREQALDWVYAQERKSLDFDNHYGAQCVDLINYYYKHLGVPVVYGNAYTFINNRLPNGWTRIQNTSSFVPQPGDIAVWGRSVGRGAGHVAIVLSAKKNSFVSMDQNWDASYCKKINHTYNGFWGVIRPNFDDGVSPTGYLENVEGGNGKVKVQGWAFDADDYKKQLDIHVYIGDSSKPKSIISAIKADKVRTDVGQAYPSAGSRHGFEQWIELHEKGNQVIYVYAINVGGGENVFLGSKNVFITQDTNKPVISNVKVTDITSRGYTVSCKVTDDTAVDRVQFPTWTQKNGQDDIQKKWPTSYAASGTKSGNTYSYRVFISDHNKETGIYCTHIYAYDTNGNQASVVVPNTIIKAENVYYGDVNKDGSITAKDASLVLSAATGNVTLSVDQKKRADVNGDGKVSSVDATLILQYNVEKIDKFPVES